MAKISNVLVLNGPNLNLLGTREPELYGTRTLEDIRKICLDEAKLLKFTIDFRQTNSEAVLIDWVHESKEIAAGIVLNAAGLARTSLVLLDAVRAVRTPVIEVHITNIYKAESYRPPSYLGHGAHGVISGFGVFVYSLGLRALRHVLDESAKTSSSRSRGS